MVKSHPQIELSKEINLFFKEKKIIVIIVYIFEYVTDGE